jgi:hypothetical protein
MSWRAFALATALAAATSSGLGVSTASAGSSEEIRTSGAWAKFDDLGEKLMVGDIAKDGKGARAYLHWGRDKSASAPVKSNASPNSISILSDMRRPNAFSPARGTPPRRSRPSRS